MFHSENWTGEPEFDLVRERIGAIRETQDTTQRFEMLKELNNSLPPSIRIQFPSLITNAYVRTALDKIEDRVSAKHLPLTA